MGLDYNDYVVTDPKFFRAAEVELLLGDPTKAINKLGWTPQKTTFKQLVHLMVDSDLERVKRIGN
ncbi:GDP-mannose 4,6-dehydratase [compost metagenome]